MKKLPPDFHYLPAMYKSKYFPDFLVDKVKSAIQKAAVFIEDGGHSNDEIQGALDKMTITINDLQEAFWEHDSEIETEAREDIGDTVDRMLQFFEIDIDPEEAIRERDW
jgi:hypothetical protein